MAKPNWALGQSILQQLQADTAELTNDMSELKTDMKEIKADLRLSRTQWRYAIGSAHIAEQQRAEAQSATCLPTAQMHDVLARLDALERRPL